jgi:hypothetical protein
MSPKYVPPTFLPASTTAAAYGRWLQRKAQAHAKRDKKRGNTHATIEKYKIEIHRAVIASEGLDDYTGEPLDWSLISKYDNVKSKLERRIYKASFAALPTVDHVGDGLGHAEFRICGWRTNDLKNDLSHNELVDLCRKVVTHFESVRSK